MRTTPLLTPIEEEYGRASTWLGLGRRAARVAESWSFEEKEAEAVKVLGTALGGQERERPF